jgi:hypothetical protein
MGAACGVLWQRLFRLLGVPACHLKGVLLVSNAGTLTRLPLCDM